MPQKLHAFSGTSHHFHRLLRFQFEKAIAEWLIYVLLFVLIDLASCCLTWLAKSLDVFLKMEPENSQTLCGNELVGIALLLSVSFASCILGCGHFGFHHVSEKPNPSIQIETSRRISLQTPHH